MTSGGNVARAALEHLGEAELQRRRQQPAGDDAERRADRRDDQVLGEHQRVSDGGVKPTALRIPSSR